MHWRGHWWGTEIVADDKEDVVFLRKLATKLDKNPLITYEYGEFETSNAPDLHDGPDGGFTLTFNR